MSSITCHFRLGMPSFYPYPACEYLHMMGRTTLNNWLLSSMSVC